MSAGTLIHPENEVWFHDHPADVACSPNCYRQTDTAPVPTAVTYFIRVDGALRQVEPLTKPHREQAHVTVRVLRDGKILTVHNTEILRSY
ncbi:hypothetical protein [Microbacterium sp. NPDC089696]|uniref:hypothetical protein n=1 Tax=Microbacterium sp. NPDC089696 TaxID=3364199 RepID=UPI003803EDA2